MCLYVSLCFPKDWKSMRQSLISHPLKWMERRVMWIFRRCVENPKKKSNVHLNSDRIRVSFLLSSFSWKLYDRSLLTILTHTDKHTKGVYKKILAKKTLHHQICVSWLDVYVLQIVKKGKWVFTFGWERRQGYVINLWMSQYAAWEGKYRKNFKTASSLDVI